MNLYNLIFQMVILIPFLTQPPHERTLTGGGSRVYPNVGAAGCGLVGAGGVLGLRPRGSRCALAARASPSRLAAARASPSRRGLLYEFVLYNLYK